MEDAHINNAIASHREYLRDYAFRLTSNTESANDLCQDTIYRAIANSDKFYGGNLKAWLTTILKNQFINQYRWKKRRQNLEGTQPTDYIFESNAQMVGNTGESNIMLSELESEVNKLHPDLKTPFVMMVDGFKYEEIADELNAPLGTIKSRIHIARKHLTRSLSKMYGTHHLAELAA